MSLQNWLCAHGHVASTRDLTRAGFGRVARANADGVVRLKRGVYSCTHFDEQALSAGRMGCLLDCTTALERHGIWSGIAPPGTHWRARPNHHTGDVHSPVVLHWSKSSLSSQHPFEVSALDSLSQAIRCLSPYDALASLESAMHLGYASAPEVERTIRQAPLHLQTVLRRLNLGAQSGYETHARLKLEDAGHAVRTQAQIPGAGALDILVDDCVGVETDGRKWHGADRFLPDRTKDLVVESWGIRVIRIAGPHIFEYWPVTLSVIERMIAESPRTTRPAWPGCEPSRRDVIPSPNRGVLVPLSACCAATHRGVQESPQ
jgi:very-short-patch-repair endonuclease